MIRRVFWIGLLVGLAACSAPAGEAQITLRVVSWASALEAELDQRIADQFAAQHLGVRVVVESVPTNYREKLFTSIASGAPPDLFLLDLPQVPAFVNRGLVLDLAPFVDRVGYDPSAVFPNVLEIFQRGERLYALPKDFTPIVLYYNRALLQAQGLPMPPETGWTWAEWLAHAQALTRDTNGDDRPDQFALNVPRRMYEWTGWVWSAGTDFLDPTGQQGTGFLNHPNTVSAFQFLADLHTQWQVSPPVDFVSTQGLQSGQSPTQRFYAGTQAFLCSGHWTMIQLLKYQQRGKLDFGVTAIPHRAGAAPETVMYAAGWAVPINARHRRLSVELAAHMGGVAAQRLRAQTGLAIPAHRGLAQQMAAADTTGRAADFLRIADQARPSWGAYVARFREVEELSNDILDRHLLRGEDLRAITTEIAHEMDRILAQ